MGLTHLCAIDAELTNLIVVGVTQSNYRIKCYQESNNTYIVIRMRHSYRKEKEQLLQMFSLFLFLIVIKRDNFFFFYILSYLITSYIYCYVTFFFLKSYKLLTSFPFSVRDSNSRFLLWKTEEERKEKSYPKEQLTINVKSITLKVLSYKRNFLFFSSSSCYLFLFFPLFSSQKNFLFSSFASVTKMRVFLLFFHQIKAFIYLFRILIPREWKCFEGEKKEIKK